MEMAKEKLEMEEKAKVIAREKFEKYASVCLGAKDADDDAGAKSEEARNRYMCMCACFYTLFLITKKVF